MIVKIVNGPIATVATLELDGGPEYDRNIVDNFVNAIKDIPYHIDEQLIGLNTDDMTDCAMTV